MKNDKDRKIILVQLRANALPLHWKFSLLPEQTNTPKPLVQEDFSDPGYI